MRTSSGSTKVTVGDWPYSRSPTGPPSRTSWSLRSTWRRRASRAGSSRTGGALLALLPADAGRPRRERPGPTHRRTAGLPPRPAHLPAHGRVPNTGEFEPLARLGRGSARRLWRPLGLAEDAPEVPLPPHQWEAGLVIGDTPLGDRHVAGTAAPIELSKYGPLPRVDRALPLGGAGPAPTVRLDTVLRFAQRLGPDRERAVLSHSPVGPTAPAGGPARPLPARRLILPTRRSAGSRVADGL